MKIQAQRIWNGNRYKGEEGYLVRQRKYELTRTLILFLIALGIFILGYISTETSRNLMSVLAALGCLPASRSAVITILFFRYSGCPKDRADILKRYSPPKGGVYLYDMVFTTEHVNYELDHICVCGRNIRMLSHSGGARAGKGMKDTDLVSHLSNSLKKDGIKDASIKVFHEMAKYEQGLPAWAREGGSLPITEAVVSTLKSLSL